MHLNWLVKWFIVDGSLFKATAMRVENNNL